MLQRSMFSGMGMSLTDLLSFVAMGTFDLQPLMLHEGLQVTVS